MVRCHISWQQALGAGTIAVNNITATPGVLGHLKIQMISTAEMPNICFNVLGAAFDDQFFTACGPFVPGLAFADCNGANAGIQVFDYDGSDCSGAIIGGDLCSSITTWTIASGWSPGVPDSTMEAIFEDSYDTANGDITACRIIVQNDATLSVGAGEFVVVETDITVDAGGAISVAHQGKYCTGR